MIEDLLSEFVVDFSVERREKKEQADENKSCEKEDWSKVTRLQIININGEIVDA